MSISESLFFIYDNVNFYEQFGIINVHVDSGLYDESFLSNRTIIEQKIRKNPVPYFQEIQEDTLELKLSFAFSDKFDEEKIREVARNLKKDFYAPLIFSENPDRIFFALCTDNPRLIHTGLGTGYISLNFRCNAPWSFSPIYSSPIYDYSSNSIEGTQLKFTNKGNLSLSPLINVEMASGTSFSIQNLSDGGKLMSFTDLEVAEILEINCELEDIKTNVPLIYRYGNMNGDFLSLNVGVSNLLVKGNIKLQFQYEYRII